VVLLLLALPARADIIQTQTFGPQVPDYEPVLTFNQYTGNLSDLTGIIVELSLTATGGLAQVDNESSTTANVDVEFGTSGFLDDYYTTVTLPSELSNYRNPMTSVNTGSFTLGPDDGDGSGVQSGGDDYDELVGGTVTDSLSGTVSSSDWGDYVGTGTFDITAVIETYLDVTGASGVSQGSTPPTVNGYITITYQTAGGGPGGAAPEPATLLLLSSGLGSLAAWRYRRRRKQSRQSQ